MSPIDDKPPPATGVDDASVEGRAADAEGGGAMSDDRVVARSPADIETETRRKAVHVSMVLFAVLLRWLSWKAALVLAGTAVVFNVFVLPMFGGETLQRESDRRRGWAPGIVLYPVAILGLVLLFRDALAFVAIGWALLALGDGMAGLVGASAGGRRLPWNPEKTWAGLLAFILFGSVSATWLANWVGAGVPVGAAGPELFGPLAAVSAVALAVVVASVVAALVESIDSGFDDNLTVPFLGAGVAWITLHAMALWPERIAEEVAGRATVAGIACLVLAVAASLAGSITRAGGVAGVLVGVLIWGFGGFGAFACLATFFILGSAATKVGRRIKEERGIAEGRGGRRSVGNVLANGGAAALAATLVLPSVRPDLLESLPALSALPVPSGAGAAAALSSFAAIALVAALATAAFDTMSSEVGKAFGRRTLLPTTGRPVPPGTEGAVSLEGTAAGVAGALIVAVVGLAFGLVPGAAGLLAVAVGAFVGTSFETIVGAWSHRRGLVLDTHVLNFANTVVGALAAVAFHAA